MLVTPEDVEEDAPGQGDEDDDDDATDLGALATCTGCGWSVAGASCATNHAPELLFRNGFFERVWCAYVWSCKQGCGRKAQGGLFADGTATCGCGGKMEMLDYVERNGPPTN